MLWVDEWDKLGDISESGDSESGDSILILLACKDISVRSFFSYDF